jgi:hypothetical protein
MKMEQVTGIGRLPLDPNYRTTIIIAILATLSVILGAVYQWVTGSGFLGGMWWGFQLGLAIFFSWAIAREVDPDHDLSAFTGLPFTILGFWFLGPPSILFAFWFLVQSRIVNRSTGLTPKITDSLLLFGLGSWLTLSGNWIFGLITALAFYLDSRLSPRLPRQNLFASASFLITMILFAFRRDTFGGFQFSPPILLGAIGIILLFAPVVYTSRKIDSSGDQSGEPLNPQRVQAAQILALATGLQLAVWSGGPDTLAISQFWGALLGVSIYRLYLLLLPPQLV